MKKNIMMRLSALLLVAVLLTTCVISGTFAKYVTTGSAKDSARVAKWGVTVTAEAFENDQLEADLKTEENEISINGEAELLAPGTGINFASVTVKGTPEVAVKVTYTAELELTNWEVNGKPYMPLVFVINNKQYSYAGVNVNSIEEFEQKIEEIIAAYTETYEENTDLLNADAGNLKVSCFWAYEGNTDENDTALGDAAANGTAPVVNLTINCTVTQID